MTSPTTQPQISLFSISLRDLPFHQLYEKDITQMTENELRELAKVVREQAGSGAARKAQAVKQAKIIEKKIVTKTKFEDFMS